MTIPAILKSVLMRLFKPAVWLFFNYNRHNWILVNNPYSTYLHATFLDNPYLGHLNYLKATF